MNRGMRWLGKITPVQRTDPLMRAVDTAYRIDSWPSATIVITRDNGDGNVVNLPAQTIRIEVIQNIRSGVELRDALVAISKQYIVLVGYLNHPTIRDADLKRADTFMYKGRMYEIIEIIDTIPGRLLASADLTP